MPTTCHSLTDGYVHCSLLAAGLSESNVAAIWLKDTNNNPPPNQFPSTAQTLQCDIETLITGSVPTSPSGCSSSFTFEGLQKHFQNLKVIYLASRTYAGYANDTQNPETYSYETGFANKWAIS